MRKLGVQTVLKDTNDNDVMVDGRIVTVGASLCQLIERRAPKSTATAKTLLEVGAKISQCEGPVALENAEYNHLKEHFSNNKDFFLTIPLVYVSEAFEAADQLYRDSQKKSKTKDGDDAE
jgi:hypothetical protein